MDFLYSLVGSVMLGSRRSKKLKKFIAFFSVRKANFMDFTIALFVPSRCVMAKRRYHVYIPFEMMLFTSAFLECIFSTMFFSILGLRELHYCGDLLESRPIINTRILIDAFVVYHFYFCFRVLRIKTKCNEKFKFLLSKKVYIYVLFFACSLFRKNRRLDSFSSSFSFSET